MKRKIFEDPIEYDVEFLSAEELADRMSAEGTEMSARWIRELTQKGVLIAEDVKGKRGSQYDYIKNLRQLIFYYMDKSGAKRI